MSGLEFNKIAGAVLLAGLTAMVVGKTASLLYHPEEAKERGYSIEVTEAEPGEAVAKETGPVNIALFLDKADPAKGQALTKPCLTCHDFSKGGPNKVGPNLYGIVGNKLAHSAGFSYSKDLAGKGGTWGFQELSEFLTKPKAFIPGTKMAYAGMKAPEQRADLLAYLNTLSDAPLPIPAAPVETFEESQEKETEKTAEPTKEEIQPKAEEKKPAEAPGAKNSKPSEEAPKEATKKESEVH